MEPEVRRRLNELIRAVRISAECREYDAARHLIDSDQEKRRSADEFRRLNYLYQNCEDTQMPDASAQRTDLYRRREELRRDPVIDRYLRAELDLCRMLRQIGLEVLSVENLDLERMEDLL